MKDIVPQFDDVFEEDIQIIEDTEHRDRVPGEHTVNYWMMLDELDNSVTVLTGRGELKE
jgi:hypothetical protein